MGMGAGVGGSSGKEKFGKSGLTIYEDGRDYDNHVRDLENGVMSDGTDRRPRGVRNRLLGEQDDDITTADAGPPSYDEVEAAAGAGAGAGRRFGLGTGRGVFGGIFDRDRETAGDRREYSEKAEYSPKSGVEAGNYLGMAENPSAKKGGWWKRKTLKERFGLGLN